MITACTNVVELHPPRQLSYDEQFDAARDAVAIQSNVTILSIQTLAKWEVTLLGAEIHSPRPGRLEPLRAKRDAAAMAVVANRAALREAVAAWQALDPEVGLPSLTGAA